MPNGTVIVAARGYDRPRSKTKELAPKMALNNGLVASAIILLHRIARRALDRCWATVVFVSLGVASTPVAAHLPGVGVGSLVVTRDQATGTRGYGLESNAAVLIFNAGLSLRHWENDIIGWNGRRLHNEATVYVGLGLLNFIQFQRGFSNGGSRSRVRVDLPFVSEQEKWGRFAKGIVISPFVETGSGKKAYGLGIGLAYF